MKSIASLPIRADTGKKKPELENPGWNIAKNQCLLYGVPEGDAIGTRVAQNGGVMACITGSR